MPKVCHSHFQGHSGISVETAYLVDSKGEPLEATPGFDASLAFPDTWIGGTVEQLQELVEEKGWKETEQVRGALHDRIVTTFDSISEEDPLPDGTPTVLLVYGVKGL